ncbi:conjugal transfer protein TraD [Chryseobacterium sp. 18068]|uniref:conjugal transfer protein TraD n=1 Tax=Chryseobacterium sp. 18068 TaxID=2681414 RepID=UPI001E50C88F|nr:conjugal transfer protein TraD [Chryseobacterium sp. 18068]
MEIIIVICLVIIILLLLHDKIIIKQAPSSSKENKGTHYNTHNIMGETKTFPSHELPTSPIERQKMELEIDPSNLDIEYDVNENSYVQNLQEELEKNLNSELDFFEEEEQWKKYRIIEEDNGFAQGVTFEELSSTKMMLQQDVCDTSEKEIALAVVQKIHGTDLYTLLENSIENASDKIAELLDKSFDNERETGSSIMVEKSI